MRLAKGAMMNEFAATTIAYSLTTMACEIVGGDAAIIHNICKAEKDRHAGNLGQRHIGPAVPY